MQCKNSKIQNAINNIFFVMLYSNMDMIGRVHTPQPKQNSRLFPGYFQALKTFFQAVCVKYEQEASHKV